MTNGPFLAYKLSLKYFHSSLSACERSLGSTLGKSLGTLYLQDLQRGGNAHYTSEHFKQELVEALAETVAKPIQENLCKSPFFFLYV